MKAVRMLILLTALSIAFVAPTAVAKTLTVDNAFGDVSIVVAEREKPRITARTPAGLGVREDLDVTASGDRIMVVAAPRDGGVLHVEVELPLDYAVEAKTGTGAISLTGAVSFARFDTETGAIRVEAPLRGTRFQLDSSLEPKTIKLPAPGKIKFIRSAITLAGGRTLWRLRDSLPERAAVTGTVRVAAKRPDQVTLVNWIPPRDWPVKFHWQAPDLLEQLDAGRGRAPDMPQPNTPGLPSPGIPLPDAQPEQALFRSEVRLVNFTLTATDKNGRPITDLTAEDFQVTENGKTEETVTADAESAPFNLVLLLDMSGSARLDREPMVAAARGFIELAGPQDRIAVYALAEDLFQVVSRLTSDHGLLLQRLEDLPTFNGGSPLYDAVTLAYAEELHARAGERNAVIVVTDGLDNQISNQELPSSVKYKRLVQAAESFEALIYPVYLRSAERFRPKWAEKARDRLGELAAASGGRLFTAASVEDLAPVFPQVAEELRGVYSIAYRPSNQQFDGQWRRVRVKVRRPDVVVRAREGYYAR